ncbi:Protein GrpE [uncultured archaeon]|nr:Protein GrpE [uncultured archaeon]
MADKILSKDDAAKREKVESALKDLLSGNEGVSPQPPEKKESAPQKKEGEAPDKLASLTDSMLRLQAEFDNYKKRTAKEKEQLTHQSEAKLMLKFIPVYEELGMAEKEAQKIQDEPLKKGILLVLSKLRSSFEKEGLAEMKLEGEKFDPFRHEAAMHEPSDLPEGAIARVIKKGYTFRGEILRHAIVSVSSGKKEEQKTEEKPANE